MYSFSKLATQSEGNSAEHLGPEEEAEEEEEEEASGWRRRIIGAGGIPVFTGLRLEPLGRSQTHGAALALRGLCGAAVSHILTHHVLTSHRARLANTDPARLRVPDLIAGVDSAVSGAGILVGEVQQN